MESGGEDLDNIFEDSETRENDGQPNETENNAKSNSVKVQPPKRIVKNPRLKFNPERLCGERGIPVLKEHFKNVKFKGKGHEKEDLDTLLSKLEHWTHRLFPSMKFEDCLHHIEKLGKKRPVQTCVRKIRLNMPILNSDFVKDDEEDDVQRNEDTEPVEVDPFDRLIGESQNLNPITATESMMDSDSLSVYSSPAQRDPAPESRGQVLGSVGSSLTEEQKERLERNRMLAIERRKAKLTVVQQNAIESPLVSNDERSSSQDLIAQPFDSLIGIRENKSDDLLMNNSNKKDDEKISSELNNPNSENLGLDDLIDLVDEEEPNLTISSSDQSAMVCVNSHEKTANKDKFSEDSELQIKDSNLEDHVSCSTLDDSVDMAIPYKTVEATEGESLKLESLMDLVNEDSE